MKQLVSNSLLILLMLLTIGLWAQQKEPKPEEEIKVNKEYDEQGNLIRYDSTYVYTWSSDSSFHFVPDSLSIHHYNFDEIHKRMREHMKHFFPKDTTGQDIFGHPFFNDDFFSGFAPNEEFFSEFEKMLEENMKFRHEHFEDMHLRIDSLMQRFHKRFHRPHYEQPDTKTKPEQKKRMSQQNSKSIQL